MDIQWYPGHMTKAKRQMQEDLKLVDLIIELIDARIPCAGRNPDLKELGANKARMIVLSKADLADESLNKAWKAYYEKQGIPVLLADTRNRASVKSVLPLVKEACREKLERDARRGIKNRPIRAMVVGIPNVGKSTFINSCAGRASAKTGNKPGVTKGKQWIHLAKGLDLLDTPGLLWPKLEDPESAKKLAMIGTIRDEILNIEELSLDLIAFLKEQYPGLLRERYDTEESETPVKILEGIATVRNCLKKAGELSYEKAAKLLTEEFRSGVLGRCTLERPEGS